MRKRVGSNPTDRTMNKEEGKRSSFFIFKFLCSPPL